MAWELTSLNSGAPADSGYTWTIGSLSATTVYSYRAYVIIDGIAYYGETYTGMTAIAPTYAPSAVTTGDAVSVGQNTFIASGNSIGYKDALPIQEYGVLYTQNSFYGTSANLTYENLNNTVHRRYTCADTGAIPPTFTYNTTPTGLTSAELTYYRAYAKNGSGVGYGNVYCQATSAAPVTTFAIGVSLMWVGAFEPLTGFGGDIRLFCDGNLASTCSYDDYSKMALTSWNVNCGHAYSVDFSLVTAQLDGYGVMPDTCWCFVGDPSYCYSFDTPDITCAEGIQFEIRDAGGAI